jgi:hypothetical protein
MVAMKEERSTMMERMGKAKVGVKPAATSIRLLL